jgi:hypothetical protein
MSQSSWYIEFYRADQASDYATAKTQGAVRKYPVMSPAFAIDDTNPFDYGELADIVDIVLMSSDMMEHRAAINFVLTCDGNICAEEPPTLPIGMRKPYRWIPPTDIKQLVKRFEEARDNKVDPREVQFLCQCGASMLKPLLEGNPAGVT